VDRGNRGEGWRKIILRVVSRVLLRVETGTPGGSWICLSVRGVHLTVSGAWGWCRKKERGDKWRSGKSGRPEKLYRNVGNSKVGDRIGPIR